MVSWSVHSGGKSLERAMSQPTRTILIVDDSPEDRELYRRYLRRDGEYLYIIQEATLGQQGLDLWQQCQPDAVLLDYRLPDLNGLEFLSRLQPLSQPLRSALIMVTGQGNEAIAVEAMKAGAQDYLVKEHMTAEGLQRAVRGAIETVQLRLQLQQRIEREQLISQITRKIHQTLALEEILETTVREVRQFLQSDRVLILRLQGEGWGTVVTESVACQWMPLLSMSYYDPCFNVDYTESFCQGLISAKTDIRDGSMASCHVELLTQLQVRANLVVPILQEKQLWGMLVAHHCAAPRQWQSIQIELLAELATQLGIALQRAELYQQAQEELRQRRRIEAELRESEQRFRTSVENMLDCFGIYSAMRDERGNIVDFRVDYVNDAACLANQMTRKEQLGRGLCEILPGHIESGLFDDYCLVVETGQSLVKENLIYEDEYGQQRLVRAFDIRIAKLGDGFVATWRDITDRKQIEVERQRNHEIIRQQLQEIEAIYQNTPVGLAILDRDLRYVRLNQLLAEINGISIDEHLGRTVREIIPDLADELERRFHYVLKTGEPLHDLEITGETPAQPGVKRTWLENWFPLRDTDGQIIGINAVIQDITPRKQAELELRYALQKLNFHVENTPLGVVEWDCNMRVIRWSKEAERIFGWSAEEAIGASWTQWRFVHEEDIEAVDETIDRMTEGNAQRTISSNRNYTKLGEIVHCVWYNSGLYDETGQIISILSLVQNVTDRVFLESERYQILAREKAARAEAERANRIKDEFLAILSHELRSPLNPILGWSQLLRTRQFETQRMASGLETIERNAKLQAQLIDDLLDVAKILRGKLNMEIASVDLAFVIEAAIDTVRASAVAKSILLNPVLPRIGRVSGDAARLQQIVWNLLSNAIKFTPDRGRVDIRLQRVGDRAQMTVSDTGKGIASEFLPYILESFRQEDASTTRAHGGLGLGLAIVRHLVEAHGGAIAADSPGVGQGATFTVCLPLLESELEITQTEESLEQEPDLTGIRVLAVDDEPDARELLTVVLNQYGAEVLTVASAAEALTRTESFQPDVLVSDIGMPEMDGYTLIQQIRALPRNQGGQIPAIALTAYAREEDSQKAKACGYQRHLAKPINLEQLIRAVAALVQFNTH